MMVIFTGTPWWIQAHCRVLSSGTVPSDVVHTNEPKCLGDELGHSVHAHAGVDQHGLQFGVALGSVQKHEREAVHGHLLQPHPGP